MRWPTGQWRGREQHAGDRAERLRFALLFTMALLIPVTVALSLLGWTPGEFGGLFLLELVVVATVLFAVARQVSPLFDFLGAGFARLLIAQGGKPVPRGYSEQEALVIAGRPDAAIDSYRSLLVAYPDDLEARVRLAALLAARGHAIEAGRHYRIARDRAPDPALALRISTGLAALHRAAGDTAALRRELATCAARFAGTASGEHARHELAALEDRSHH